MELKEFFDICEKYDITDKDSLIRVVSSYEDDGFMFETGLAYNMQNILETYFSNITFKNEMVFDYFENTGVLEIFFDSKNSLFEEKYTFQLSVKDKIIKKPNKSIALPVMYNIDNLKKKDVKEYFDFIKNLKEDFNILQNISFEDLEKIGKEKEVFNVKKAPKKNIRIMEEDKLKLLKVKETFIYLFNNLKFQTVNEIKQFLKIRGITDYNAINDFYSKMIFEENKSFYTFKNTLEDVIKDIIYSIDKDVNFEITDSLKVYFKNEEIQADICFSIKYFENRIEVSCQNFNPGKNIPELGINKSKQFFENIMSKFKVYKNKDKKGEYTSYFENGSSYNSLYKEFTHFKELSDIAFYLKEAFC